MELKIRKNGDVYIIDVNGEMDLYNSYKLKELVMKMIEKNMNLKLAISNIHGSVKKVIELTKLMGYFPIANSVEEALLMVKE